MTGTAADNDQDFVLQSADNNVPNRYFGPSLLDRTHQISFGGYVDVPCWIPHWADLPFRQPVGEPRWMFLTPAWEPAKFSAPTSPGMEPSSDPLPGTHFGQFDRGINASSINALINNYNTNVASQATPRGQGPDHQRPDDSGAIASLGGVAQPICQRAPANQVEFQLAARPDLRLAWRHTFAERFTIEPSVGIFNLFNFANFNLPPNTMSGILTGSPGAINGTTPGTGTCNPNDPMACGNNAFRVGNGTGVYAVGAPRQVEWGVRSLSEMCSCRLAGHQFALVAFFFGRWTC